RIGAHVLLSLAPDARLRTADVRSLPRPCAAGSVAFVVMRAAADDETAIRRNPTPWAGRKDQPEAKYEREYDSGAARQAPGGADHSGRPGVRSDPPGLQRDDRPPPGADRKMPGCRGCHRG